MTAEPSLKLWVPADGNTVLEERYLRSLRGELAEVDGVDARIEADATSAPANTKAGSLLGELALWVGMGVAGADTVALLLEGIRAWSAKQHDRIVYVRTKDGSEYQLPPDTDEAQQHLVERILDNERS